MTARNVTSIAHLERHHRGLDGRVRALNSRSYLSQGEQLLATRLKKRRLRTKDRIDSLRRLVR